MANSLNLLHTSESPDLRITAQCSNFNVVQTQRPKETASVKSWRPSNGFLEVSWISFGKTKQSRLMEVTDDYLRAYFTRPEIHTVESSCAAEHLIFEKLMENPREVIRKSELDEIADKDARENYRIILRFRDHLIHHETVKKTYISLFSESVINFPPVFIAQIVHLILRYILDGTTNPMHLRVRELFFRDQIVSIDSEQVLLADLEIVEVQGKTESVESTRALAQEYNQSNEVEMYILREENKSQYWQRSDNFDMSADCRFTQPLPMEFLEPDDAKSSVNGKPVYLAVP